MAINELTDLFRNTKLNGVNFLFRIRPYPGGDFLIPIWGGEIRSDRHDFRVTVKVRG